VYDRRADDINDNATDHIVRDNDDIDTIDTDDSGPDAWGDE
jgi:hypothetical protein